MLLLEGTVIGLLPQLLVKFYVIVASQAEYLLWVKMTAFIVLVVSEIPFVQKWDLMDVLLPGVNVAPKESYAPLSAITMNLSNVIYWISLHMSAATARCRKVARRTKLTTLLIRQMQLITTP